MELRCANALCAVVSKLTCASYELDERFPALQCRDDHGEFSIETAQQFNPTSIPDSYPNDGRAVVQETVDGEVFALRDDHGSHIRGARANLIIGCLLRAMVSHMFRRMAERFNSSCECRRELSVDEKPQSCAPQHGVIVLLRGELQDRGDVVGLEIGIVRQDLFAGGAGSQEIEHVLDADTQTANARTAATNVGTHRDALDRAHTMIVTWLVHEKEQYGG